jgi:hypothetical protein
MDPVWQKNLAIYRSMSEDEKDKYMTNLSDSLVHLKASAKEIVIRYMEFLTEHGEITAAEEADKLERDTRPMPETECSNCPDRHECSPGFGKKAYCNPGGY